VPVARDMVVDSMDDGVIVLDAQRRLVDLNAAAERYTGCTPQSWPSDRRSGRVVDRRRRRDRPLADGQPAIVKVEPGPRYFEGQGVGGPRFATALCRLAGDRPRHLEPAPQRGRALRFDRRVQEQQKSESLMVLAGGVAHDFNNLLTGILGNADLISILSPPDSDQRRAAEAIVIGAQRAADLVSKMLAYSGGGRVGGGTRRSRQPGEGMDRPARRVGRPGTAR
jgi:signal transduction histidine kinase